MKPLTVSLLHRDLKFQNPIFLLPVLTQYVYLIHIFSIPIFFSKSILCGGLLNRSSLIHNSEFPFPISKKLETLAYGKVCFLTMRNVVINSHKDRSGLFLCKKSRVQRL